jgi:ribosomal protein S19
MSRYSRVFWLLIKNRYFYNRYFILNKNLYKSRAFNFPEFFLDNKFLYVYNGKTFKSYRLMNSLVHFNLGELSETRKYRPAKFRKSKKAKK